MIVTFNAEAAMKSMCFDSAAQALQFIASKNEALVFAGAQYRYIPVSPTMSELTMMAFEDALNNLNAQIEADRPKSEVETYAAGGAF